MKKVKQQSVEINKVYEKYADLLYRIALSNLQSEQDAQDVLQDVFEKYMRTNKKFENAEHEQAWLIRVTVNRSYDILRKRKIRNHASLDEIADSFVGETGLEKREQISVMEHLAKIPEKYRSVIVLHYLEGFSVAEIAGIAKISVSAVKMRLQRGRKFLWNQIKEDENV